jgi:anti-sigma B factor antagonist
MQLDIDSEVVHGHTVVVPRGELDLVTQTELKRYVNDLVVNGQVHLVIDLDQTTFLDSTGLGALISARRQTHTFQGSFAIVCSQPRILRLFKIVSLDKVFTIHASRDELAEEQLT